MYSKCSTRLYEIKHYEQELYLLAAFSAPLHGQSNSTVNGCS